MLAHSVPLDGMTAQLRFSDAGDGDFQVLEPANDIEQRRRAVVDRPWSWLRQVHGDTIFEVAVPGQHAGDQGDGLITSVTGCPISVTTADCAPVVLVAERAIAVVHAGWRGLMAGIIEQTGERLQSIGGAPVAAFLGPCIHPEAYEFGREELDTVIERFGPEVESRTDDGKPALDVPAAVAMACRQSGWSAPVASPCTSSNRYFSYRTRADAARQVAVAWLEAPEAQDG